MKLLTEAQLTEVIREGWNNGYKVAQETYAPGGVAEDPTAMRDDIEREEFINGVVREL